MEGLSKEKDGDTVLFSAACRHIMAVTLESRLNIDKQQSRKYMLRFRRQYIMGCSTNSLV
jgi:hypothetical protein